MPPLAPGGEASQPSHKRLLAEMLTVASLPPQTGEQLDVPDFRTAICSPDLVNLILTLLVPNRSHSGRKK